MIKFHFLRPFFFLMISVAYLAVVSPLQAQDGIAQQTYNALPFVTNRNLTGEDDPESYFGDERGSERSGWCHVRQTKVPALSSISEAAPFRIPGEFLKVTDIREALRSEVYSALEAVDIKRAPVLYTHGYNVGFEKGCRRATTLQNNANLKDGFLWFSWPADGIPTNYMRDETDLYWSAPSLADLIAEMSQRFDPQGINVTGHSLGGRGVALALYVMAAQHPGVALNNVVLLAPDMDFGTFVRILPSIRGLAKRIAIYTTVDDRALEVSERLHGYRRLGQSGNPVELLEGVEVVDISELPIDSATGHLYHIYGARVGNDLDQLLNQGLGAEQREGLRKIGDNHWSMISED
ncbi:MAG: alpha/beta hydrolase [Marinovum sp.]|nr:alpha/beta hydrolase [Marinovum sp.]